MRRLLATSDSALLLLLRLTLAVVFFAHGAQKALGWFGGAGFSATMAGFTGDLHLPAALAALAIAAELLGAVALCAGFLARFAALALACNMAVAIATVHARAGFFMNWQGRLPAGSEGCEFHLLALALLVTIVARGAGALSVDGRLTRTRELAVTLPREEVLMVSFPIARSH
ncbi:MAG TPA: DoxX family protein [Polyangia bacterium]|jgi:putative oxidoreductase